MNVSLKPNMSWSPVHIWSFYPHCSPRKDARELRYLWKMMEFSPPFTKGFFHIHKPLKDNSGRESVNKKNRFFFHKY